MNRFATIACLAVILGIGRREFCFPLPASAQVIYSYSSPVPPPPPVVSYYPPAPAAPVG